MSRVSMKVAVAAGAAVLLGAGWLGASVQSGRVLEAGLNDLVGAGQGATGLAFTRLRHESGWLSSRGRVQLSLREACRGPGEHRDRVALEIEYAVSHLVRPAGLAAFSWTAQPQGETGAALARVLGAPLQLSGEGRMGFDRSLESSIAAPELKVALPAGSRAGEVRVAALEGRVRMGAQAFSLDLAVPEVTVRGAGDAVEAKRLAVALELADRARGLGSFAFTVATFASGSMTGEGLRIASHSVERGDRVDLVFAPSLKQVGRGTHVARDLELEIGVRDLHSPSVQTLQAALAEGCEFSQLPEPARARVREAVRALIQQGFSVGLTRLKGALADGRVDARLEFELPPALSPGDAASLQGRVRARGEVSIAGGLLPAAQREMLLAMGAASEGGGVVKAAFEFAGGATRVNGRVIDGSALGGLLAGAERQLGAFLEGRSAAAEDARDKGDAKAEVKGDDAPAAGPGGTLLPAPVARP